VSFILQTTANWALGACSHENTSINCCSLEIFGHLPLLQCIPLAIQMLPWLVAGGIRHWH